MSDVVGLPALLERLLGQMPPYVTWILAALGGVRRGVGGDGTSRRSDQHGDRQSAAQQGQPGPIVRDAIVPRINAQYGVYVQDSAGEWSFSVACFEAYCVRAGIAWPRHESGKLDLRDKTFDSHGQGVSGDRKCCASCAIPATRCGRSSWRSAPTGEIEPCCGRSPSQDRPHPAESLGVDLLSGGVAADPHQAGARARASPIIDWSGMEFQIAAALSNCQPMLDLYASGIPIHRICPAVRRSAAGCDQEIPPAHSRALQGRLPRRAVRHAVRAPWRSGWASRRSRPTRC